MDLHYSDGVAAERTMIALEGTAVAFQSRLPKGWDLVPNTRDDRCDAAPFGKAVP